MNYSVEVSVRSTFSPAGPYEESPDYILGGLVGRVTSYAEYVDIDRENNCWRLLGWYTRTKEEGLAIRRKLTEAGYQPSEVENALT